MANSANPDDTPAWIKGDLPADLNGAPPPASVEVSEEPTSVADEPSTLVDQTDDLLPAPEEVVPADAYGEASDKPPAEAELELTYAAATDELDDGQDEDEEVFDDEDEDEGASPARAGAGVLDDAEALEMLVEDPGDEADPEDLDEAAEIAEDDESEELDDEEALDDLEEDEDDDEEEPEDLDEAVAIIIVEDDQSEQLDDDDDLDEDEALDEEEFEDDEDDDEEPEDLGEVDEAENAVEPVQIEVSEEAGEAKAPEAVIEAIVVDSPAGPVEIDILEAVAAEAPAAAAEPLVRVLLETSERAADASPELAADERRPEPAPEREAAPPPEPPVVEHLSLEAQLESLLFVADGAVPVGRLAEALEVSPRDIETALTDLGDSYRLRGLSLQRFRDKVQLTTSPSAAAQVERFLGLAAATPLSRAALEALAIIAYQQPVTRPQIEAVRGVNSDSVIKNLLTKGLIEESGRADGPGRPVLYSTTHEFMQHFGLASLADLPPLSPPSDEAALDPARILKG